MAETLVLFLHHLNENNRSLTESNFSSFSRCGNEILGLHDSDSEGLPGSVAVSVNSKIPRGNRWTSPDSVFLNYILENKDNLSHKRYMLCEYDCYCECNIDVYCQEYLQFDVCSPHVVTKENDPGWGWFKNIFLDCDPVGFRPATFLLFSKESIVSVAEKYLEVWEAIKNSNCEARLGSISSLLGLKIGSFSGLEYNVSWGPTKFRRNMKLYHPVKTDFSTLLVPKPKTSEYSGAWTFGRLKDQKISTIILERDGTIANYDNYNEVYWSEEDGKITFYSGRGGITSVFLDVNKDGSVCVGDHYDGNISGEAVLIKDYHWISKVQL